MEAVFVAQVRHTLHGHWFVHGRVEGDDGGELKPAAKHVALPSGQLGTSFIKASQSPTSDPSRPLEGKSLDAWSS